MDKNLIPHKKISFAALLAFFITFSFSAAIITVSIANRGKIERIAMEQLITEKSIRANTEISKLLYKTQTLSVLVIQSDGAVSDFESVAATLMDDPAILNVLLAPDGVVTDVYPLKGNEAVVGLNFYEEGAGNKEAQQAFETGELVFGGPFDLVQGGQALVGRLPIYFDGPDGRKRFWGLVSVTLKYPQVLDCVELAALETQGYFYEIWRINPDNNEKQIIAHSDESGGIRERFIEKHIQILNADWYFRISPIRQWYHYPESWLMIMAGLFISFLVAFSLQNNYELRLTRADLENLSRKDFLTEIPNRYYFMELAPTHIERSFRANSSCFIIMFDLDYFKKINDTYGHQAGDATLKSVAQTALKRIRPYDILARYGGEEFIILASEMDEVAVQDMAERIRIAIANTPVPFKGTQISVRASFGIAYAAPIHNLDTAISLADQALYTAKEQGRNRVVFLKNRVTNPDIQPVTKDRPSTEPDNETCH